jgi:ubiquinone/menaquinone biosynthesis C-methylase UbiE
VSERARWARSFGSAADLYEANRPSYAEAAIDWLFERLPMHEVLDLGAGTGKLTRQLVARGAHVVAVEPDPDMRATFAHVLPGVEMLDGRAESIPLPDGSVDVVTAGQAFHWFDLDEALPEMHRVTRPGGGLAMAWNVWTESDPILSALQRLLEANRAPRNPWREDERRGHFWPLEQRRFEEARAMTLEQLEGWATSTSSFLTASREAQESLRTEIREIVGGAAAEVLLATDVVVADRV